MSFASNGGKFKLYTVLNGLIFPTPTQPRISQNKYRNYFLLLKKIKIARMRVCGDGIFFGQLSRQDADKS
jgi:hypothetical protein